LAALVLALVAALSGVYWFLHWRLPSQAAVAGVVAVVDHALDGDAVARALGAQASAPSAAQVVVPAAEASRFVLLGVLGGSAGGALIAVDNKPAKPVALGGELIDGWTLTRVAGRSAVVSRQGVELALQLPPLLPPATLKKSP
jgi:general secretion pathway protein C